jgi:hypothetical protein
VSSTVTTATVSTVTAAITIEGLGQMLMLVALILLGMALLAKEFSVVSHSRVGRLISRGVDIGLTPLLSVFVLMIVLNAVSFFQGY